MQNTKIFNLIYKIKYYTFFILFEKSGMRPSYSFTFCIYWFISENNITECQKVMELNCLIFYSSLGNSLIKDVYIPTLPRNLHQI